MLNKLTGFIRQYGMIAPGDQVIAAVSGGADSVALLFGLYLMKDIMGFSLEAAHFNHHLRGAESDRDEAFVRALCSRYDIPLTVGDGRITPGKKGLEAAARDARYAFLRSLPGKVATAHTADDNAETVLMHLIRGTGLKGLGAIAPVSGNVIRPMLCVTREDVERFLQEYYLPHVEDSSNAGDAFLRNRIRHHVMPLLKQENPRLAENLSAMALNLRLDEECLSAGLSDTLPSVKEMQAMHPAVRRRQLERFLKESGVREPEQIHISQAESLLFHTNPSARMNFPGGVTIAREYDTLRVLEEIREPGERLLTCPGAVELPELGIRVVCEPAAEPSRTREAFTVRPQGRILVRSRRAGDAMRLSGGSKPLKKLFIDRKIPAARRSLIPVLADDRGILGVYGLGANLDRLAESGPAALIRFEEIKK